MKTLEEIKAELKEEIPVHYHLPNPEARLRHTDLMKLQNLHACTLTYIQQLESRLAQVERERDAAVHDLAEDRICANCKHYSESVFNEPCSSCVEDAETKKNWQWRGVCPENTEEETDAD